MVVVRTLAVAAWALLGLAACVETRSHLAGPADRLEHNANLLARDAADAPASDYPSTYARDARELAQDARDFRHTAADRAATDADLKVAFGRLSRSYHALRDEVEHTESRQARSDLKPVTDAYLDIEREMGGYPERRASADDIGR
jgi:hypothetical protein